MRWDAWLAVAVLISAGGCITPCGSGACNSPGSLFNLPTPRYNSTEKLLNFGGGSCATPGCATSDCGAECETGGCKANVYPTFNKYCPWFDEWHTKATAERCANKILWQQQWHLKKLMSSDYKAGFRQAFIDVAFGSDGELPALPPPVYWNAHFRNCDGKERADKWFHGYRAGAAMAAVKLAPMKRVAASYDWTVDRDQSPISNCQQVGGVCHSNADVLRTVGYRPTGPQGPAPPQQNCMPGFAPPIPGRPIGNTPLPPQMMPPHVAPPNGPPMMAPGPAGLSGPTPVDPHPMPGAVQELPPPSSGRLAPIQSGGTPGLVPGHSMPGPVDTGSPPANSRQPSGSLLPGFSGPAPPSGGGGQETPPQGLVY